MKSSARAFIKTPTPSRRSSAWLKVWFKVSALRTQNPDDFRHRDGSFIDVAKDVPRTFRQQPRPPRSNCPKPPSQPLSSSHRRPPRFSPNADPRERIRRRRRKPTRDGFQILRDRCQFIFGFLADPTDRLRPKGKARRRPPQPSKPLYPTHRQRRPSDEPRRLGPGP